MWKKKGNVHTRSDGLSVEDIPQAYLAIRHKKQIDWADLWRRMDFGGPMPVDPKIPGITIVPGINIIRDDVEALKKQLDEVWPIATKAKKGIWVQWKNQKDLVEYARSDGVEVKASQSLFTPSAPGIWYNVAIVGKRKVSDWESLWKALAPDAPWQERWYEEVKEDKLANFTFVEISVSLVKDTIDRLWPLGVEEKKTEEQLTMWVLLNRINQLESRIQKLESK